MSLPPIIAIREIIPFKPGFVPYVKVPGKFNVLLVKCRKPPTHFITYCCIEYTSPLVGLKLTTLVVIATDCTGSKSNYHTIMTAHTHMIFNMIKITSLSFAPLN
jgi:hypothetical protein